MTIKIPLSKGKFALIDDADFEKVSRYKWFSSSGPYGDYAIAYSYEGEGRKRVWMHRLLLDAPDGMFVDHRNGDRLDNTRENIRICTTRQNLGNIGLGIKNTSGYKGVTWHKPSKKWNARIRINGVKTHLGCFTDLIAAAQAYDIAAIEVFGEFAQTNFEHKQVAK